MTDKYIYMDLKKTLYLYAVLSKKDNQFSIHCVDCDMSEFPDWVLLSQKIVEFDEPDLGHAEKMIKQRSEENRIKKLDEARKRLAELEGKNNG